MNKMTEAERLMLKSAQLILAGICTVAGMMDTNDQILLALLSAWIDMAQDMSAQIDKFLGEETSEDEEG